MQESRKRGRPRDFNDKRSQSTINALDRGLDVLELLADSSGLTLSQIAGTMGQSPATISRVLATFEARDFVEADPARQTWHVGPASFRAGSAFLRRSSVTERARPIMRQLMEETGETANLGMERGGLVLFVSQVETTETIRAFFAPGVQSPMYASGIGKALLSTYGEARVLRILRRRPLAPFTGKTLTDIENILIELSDIRARGYAIDDEEKEPGMRCIAAPVFDASGEAVAGISVSGPSARLTDDAIEPTGAAVLAAARALSRAMGATTA